MSVCVRWCASDRLNDTVLSFNWIRIQRIYTKFMRTHNTHMRSVLQTSKLQHTHTHTHSTNDVVSTVCVHSIDQNREIFGQPIAPLSKACARASEPTRKISTIKTSNKEHKTLIFLMKLFTLKRVFGHRCLHSVYVGQFEIHLFVFAP